MSDHRTALTERGWTKFEHDPDLVKWLDDVRPVALATLSDERHRDWWRCDGTWFVGVNVLPNGPDGSLPGTGPLAVDAVEFIKQKFGHIAWAKGQVSVTRPGYPRQGSESEANHRYRVRRASAHVDGLKAVGEARRRMLSEPHAFILGLPLTECDAGASPLVVWEGSHEVIRSAFAAQLGTVAVEDWGRVDLTECYHAARRKIFETCRRIELPARPGEATLVHRLALHGVAPWKPGARAAEEGRAILYFRPPLPQLGDWLQRSA